MPRRMARRDVSRRDVLRGAAGALLAAGLQGCQIPAANEPARLQLPPIRASLDRVTRITVCTRPFRAAGPRLEAERIGQKLVVVK